MDEGGVEQVTGHQSRSVLLFKRCRVFIRLESGWVIILGHSTIEDSMEAEVFETRITSSLHASSTVPVAVILTPDELLIPLDGILQDLIDGGLV